MAKKDILLEIGTEEIPARFMPGALEGLEQIAHSVLSRDQVSYGKISVLGTPRRLVLHVAEVEDVVKQPVLGPPRKIALDEQGNYTKAAQGFAKSQGIKMENLEFIEERLGYIKMLQGEEVKSLLSEVLRKIIEGLSFPKSMRWGSGDFSFARSIHWIVALFGDEVLEFELAGIKSGNQSRGHRFLKPEPFELVSADLNSYKDELKKRFVVVDQNERWQLIKQQIQQVFSKTKPGCQVLEDDELLEEVTQLVEYPVVLCGSFDPEYLDLPREVLIEVLREHQKYFAVANQKGELEPAFVVVSNLPEKKEGLIRHGNERVLRARLADAQFFYKEDQKIGLSARVEGLKGVVFQEKLGSYFDKKERVKNLITEIVQGNSNTKLVVDLYKADLLTEMVQEFPKLQGVMGEEYARLEGEPEDVAVAIREHYLPRFAGGDLPKTDLGMALSIADKVDTIVGCFGVGLIPSGSQDPYALRRQALGVVNIILGWNMGLLSLSNIIEKAMGQLKFCLKSSSDMVRQRVSDFFQQRIHHILVNKGYRYDLVDATLGAGFDYPIDVERRCQALQELQQTEADWEPLAIAFKRVARIIPPERQFNAPDPKLFQEETEKELYEQFCQRKDVVESRLCKGDYLAALKELAALRPAVDKFFDDVLVMCEDEKLRENRLALLYNIAGLFRQLADFSQIVTQNN